VNSWNHLRVLGVTLLVGLCAAEALAGPAGAGTASCGSAAVQGQNGNQLYLPGTGPACLRSAFGACRSAALSVRGHGVDTLLLLTFTVERQAAGCRVVVKGSNTVFFGSKTRRTNWTSTCTRTTKRVEGVVVGGCSDSDYLLSPPGAAQVPNNRF
jgi:hypothetical protein